ncbi:Apyrase [Lamellibrachia satsuma]|nr:Apyrase [Lamellibrachia satsuma]
MDRPLENCQSFQEGVGVGWGEWGNLLTTAIWYQQLHPATDTDWATTSTALVNGGSIRANIQPGNVSVEDVMQAMPFRNYIMSVDMEGRHIIEMLEQSVKDYNPRELHGKFLQMSGIKVVYDLSKPNGKRVTQARIRCTHCDVPRFEALLPNNTYTLFTSSFITSGGDGYSMVPEHARNIVPYGNLLSDILIVYLAHRSPAVQGLEDNIVFGPPTSETPVSASGRVAVCSLLLALCPRMATGVTC